MWRWFTVMVYLVAVGVSPDIAWGQSKGEVEQGEAKRPPLVVMEKAGVVGRVIYLRDDEEQESTARGLRIRLLSGDRKKTIAETKTDDAGMYRIPKLDVGVYRLMIGKLQLDLTVLPATEFKESEEQNKIIVVFIPRDMD